MKSELARRARSYAKKTDRTFTRLIEDALTDLLDKSSSGPVPLPKLTVVGSAKSISQRKLKQAIQKLNAAEDRDRLGS